MSLITDRVLQLRTRAFKHSPRLTFGVAILGFFATLVGVTASLYFDARDARELANKRMENLSYNQQLDALNNVQGSLNNLMRFVDLQKTKLKESEDLVNSLKSEQEKLKPVVEADRKTVEALLGLQYERAQHDVWRERGIGFLLGFAASVLASIIAGIIQYIVRRKKAPPQKPATA